MTAPRLTSRLFLRIDPITLERLHVLADADGTSTSEAVRRLVTSAFVDASAVHAALPPSHDRDVCPLCKVATLTHPELSR